MLSVILPTLNEATALPHTLAHAREQAFYPETEFIVSDCNSSDATTDLANSLGARVVTGSNSRARAMNHGAAIARGNVLLFLHADCKVPHHFDRAVLAAVSRGCVGGGFDFNWASHPLSHGLNRELLRIIRITNRIRFRWTGNFYGDQGIFVTTHTFERLGGFPDLRLMEDLRFSQKLKNAGRIAVVQPALKTSPRRFVTNGVIRQFTQDLRLLALDAAGFLPESTWNQYNQLNQSASYRTTHRNHIPRSRNTPVPPSTPITSPEPAPVPANPRKSAQPVPVVAST